MICGCPRPRCPRRRLGRAQDARAPLAGSDASIAWAMSNELCIANASTTGCQFRASGWTARTFDGARQNEAERLGIAKLRVRRNAAHVGTTDKDQREHAAANAVVCALRLRKESSFPTGERPVRFRMRRDICLELLPLFVVNPARCAFARGMRNEALFGGRSAASVSSMLTRAQNRRTRRQSTLAQAVEKGVMAPVSSWHRGRVRQSGGLPDMQLVCGPMRVVGSRLALWISTTGDRREDAAHQ